MLDKIQKIAGIALTVVVTGVYAVSGYYGIKAIKKQLEENYD